MVENVYMDIIPNQKMETIRVFINKACVQQKKS